MWFTFKVFVITIALLNIGDAARRINVHKRMLDMLIHYSSSLEIQGINGKEPTINNMLGLHKGEGLKDTGEIKTATGTKKIKYEETYKGVPVFGQSVVVETTNKGSYTGYIEGQLIEGIEEDVPSVTPNLTVHDAYLKALEYEEVDENNAVFDEDEAKLEIYVEDEDEVTAKGKLAYILSFQTESAGKPSRPFYVINAISGEQLNRWQGLSSLLEQKRETVKKFANVNGVGGNIQIGKHIFGKDFDQMHVTQIGDTCFLDNPFVRVMDVNNTGWYAKSYPNETVSFKCKHGNEDLTNGAYSPANDVFVFSLATYKMYEEWYDLKPLKFKILGRVHVGRNFQNAFWNGKTISFGDGGDILFPLVEHGIVAHEISHGFTEQNSGLINRFQSGGMNEAYSDMAGETLEFFLKKKTDFKVGLGMFKNSSRPMRYMKTPKADNKSIGLLEDYCRGINVHYSSGIFNKAFYTLATKQGWDPKKAFHVFVIANKLYWRPTTRFHEGACGAKNAAKDLGYKANDVVDAFHQVGVRPCAKHHKDISMTTQSGISVPEFKDLHFKWLFIDGMSFVRIIIFGGKGIAHALVKYGSRASHKDFDYSSVQNVGEKKMY